MDKVIEFYKSEERGVVYGFYNNGYKSILDNWDVGYIKVVGGLWFINKKAFNFLEDFIKEEGLKFRLRVFSVTRREEGEVMGLLKALRYYKEDLEGEDYDAGEVTVSSDIELELGDCSISYKACSSGIVTGDGGDHWTPPTHCAEWGDVDISDISIAKLGEELDLTTGQNRFLTDYLISCINLPS